MRERTWSQMLLPVMCTPVAEMRYCGAYSRPLSALTANFLRMPRSTHVKTLAFSAVLPAKRPSVRQFRPTQLRENLRFSTFFSTVVENFGG